MYVCKVIGKIISTVKNEKLVGHSIVLVQAAALNDRGSLEADGPVFAAADTIGCGEGNFVSGDPGQQRTLCLQVCGGPGGHGRGGHSGRRSVGPLLTPCRNPEF